MPVKQKSTLGAGMLATAFVLLLLMLTWLFQSYFDAENDPANRVLEERASAGVIEMRLAADRKGHYAIAGEINGYKANFLLDTGATYVAIPESLARLVGLEKKGRLMISTANGNTSAYRTVIDQLSIGKIRLKNVAAIIHPKLDEVLLGMSALKDLEFLHSGGELTIRQTLYH